MQFFLRAIAAVGILSTGLAAIPLDARQSVNVKVTLYADANFSGASKVQQVTALQQCYNVLDFNDLTSSIVLEGDKTCLFFFDADCFGAYFGIAGNYRMSDLSKVESGRYNDQISAIRCE